MARPRLRDRSLGPLERSCSVGGPTSPAVPAGRSTAGLLAAIALLSLVFPLVAHAASDVVTVGTVTATGSTVDVPVYIRDVSGTSLGVDQPAGSKIQSFSIKVNYAPSSAVQSVTFSRAGITASLTPTSEFKPTAAGAVSLLDTFQESTDLIPFTLNASGPGNLVAHLVFTLAASATPGSAITLTLDSSLTQLTDAGGTAATKESVAKGSLSLVNGQITVPALSMSLSPGAKTIVPGGSANLIAVLSGAAPGDLTLNLSSSNTSVATVPASVVLLAGSSSQGFKVTAVALGTAKITATTGSLTANANITVSEAPPPQCVTPAAPQLSAPGSAEIGATYDVTWNAVSDATEYVIEESATPEFTSPTAQTVTGTSASFTHTTGGIRYSYRCRARNREGACDVFSSNSSVVSVLINEETVPVPDPVPARRVLAVVGSLQGNFGSFFRTSVQIYNPHDDAVSGTIVFHPAGASGSSSDPSIAYAIAPGKTLVFSDLLPEMGLEGGLGSVDLIADLTSALPVALARVFNDAGAAGTTGLAEEAMSPDDALREGNKGVLLAPAGVQRFRLNLGVRTLDQSTTIDITVRDKDGIVVKTTTKHYGPTYFAQVSSADMLGYTLVGGETITFEVKSGRAFIYGATTDNTTNDPSVQFARRIE